MILFIIIGCQNVDDPYKTWKEYKGDATGSSYSKLDQINKKNVNQLEVAWTYQSGDVGQAHRIGQGLETNPIIINDIMYAVSPAMKIIAVDAATGEEKWVFDPFKDERAVWKLRSVVYWESESGEDKRILFTASSWLYALDAEKGTLISDFGREGRIDLNLGLGRNPDTFPTVMASSPGIIYNDLLIMGSSVFETKDAAPGHIRAYDVRTGEIAWIFYTIPEYGEVGYETWEGMDEESLNRRGGANNWAGMALDRERGIVYVPTGSVVYDWYGGNRPGKNLFGTSLIALDASTGGYIWHYQIVNHDLWDYDLPAPPNLFTVEKDGESVDVVAQITKHGFIFVFNRITGEPFFPIEEKPVPHSNIESEAPWPTQPFPIKPEPFARQSFTEDNVTDITPESRAFVLNELSKYRNEGLFTPGDPQGSIMMPGPRGAGRWGGAAHDPETGILYLNSSEMPTVLTVQRQQIDRKSSLGETFYSQNCAVCHGQNREGQLPDFPALNNIKDSKSTEEVLDIIERGAGMMPAFPNISEDEKKAIIAYLFDQENDFADMDSSPLVGDNSTLEYVGVNPFRQIEDQYGFPGIKPPWGTLNAIDINTGEYKWKVPLGTYPQLAARGIPDTGMFSYGGPIVTAGGLLFIAGTEDKKLRAYDKDNGELLWETILPAAGFATPSTYMSGGRQYIVIAAGGGRGTEPGDYYVAYALPD